MSLTDARCKVQDLFSCANQICCYKFRPKGWGPPPPQLKKHRTCPRRKCLFFICLPKWHKTQCKIKEEPFRYFFLFSEVCCFSVRESNVLSAGVKTACMFVRYLGVLSVFRFYFPVYVFSLPRWKAKPHEKNRSNFQNTTALDTSTRKGARFETLNASVW